MIFNPEVDNSQSRIGDPQSEPLKTHDNINAHDNVQQQLTPLTLPSHAIDFYQKYLKIIWCGSEMLPAWKTCSERITFLHAIKKLHLNMTGCFTRQIISKRQKKQLRLESRKRNNAVSLRRPAMNQEKMKTVNDFHKLERVHWVHLSALTLSIVWLTELRFYVPFDTKPAISETFFLANRLA